MWHVTPQSAVTTTLVVRKNMGSFSLTYRGSSRLPMLWWVVKHQIERVLDSQMTTWWNVPQCTEPPPPLDCDEFTCVRKVGTNCVLSLWEFGVVYYTQTTTEQNVLTCNCLHKIYWSKSKWERKDTSQRTKKTREADKCSTHYPEAGK